VSPRVRAALTYLGLVRDPARQPTRYDRVVSGLTAAASAVAAASVRPFWLAMLVAFGAGVLVVPLAELVRVLWSGRQRRQ